MCTYTVHFSTIMEFNLDFLCTFVTVSLEVLKEMFPHIPEADLKVAFQDNFFDVDSTIEELLEKATGKSYDAL